MITPFLIGSALVLTILTLLPLWRHEAWWVRALDFPRLQILMLLLVVLLAELLLFDFARPLEWTALGATAICIAIQLWWIVPYTRLFPVEVRTPDGAHPERRISILTANVLTPNRNAAALIALVREFEPDVLVTLESDNWWQSKLEELESDYQYTLKCPLDNLYGMHLFSRLPLHDGTIEYLVESDVPSMHVSIELRSGDRIRAHFLHPTPPSPQENDESTERDAELVVVARSVSRTDDPVIVTGDLNDVAWSETTRLFRKISGLLDPRVGRGMFNTFHADYPFLRWPLDHIFHSDHFRLKHMQRLAGFGSDHFPLLTELLYVPSRREQQDGLEPDADDRALAAEKTGGSDLQIRDVPIPGAEQA